MNHTQEKECIEMAPLPLIVYDTAPCSKQGRSHQHNNDSNKIPCKIKNRTSNLSNSLIKEYFFAEKDLNIAAFQLVKEYKEVEDWMMVKKDETRNGKQSSGQHSL